ncbi:MAG: Electron transport complex protein RnfB [Haloplasmataceae bacterium]|jgi:Na+-translocating ferredoxin:NAD+ oxidoreductase RNF subunit RnfB|nr:Electron transport complex protein RnfB [Haloplasmataceae bacterium]
MEILNNGLIVAGIVGAIGAVIGLILAFASNVFQVTEDPRYDLLVKNLPGVNCGMCGYAGCSGMANGLIAGDADVKGCKPANDLTRAKVLAILRGEDPDQVVNTAPIAKPQAQVKA